MKTKKMTDTTETEWRWIPGLIGYQASSTGLMRTWYKVGKEITDKGRRTDGGSGSLFVMDKIQEPTLVKPFIEVGSKVAKVLIYNGGKKRVFVYADQIARAFSIERPDGNFKIGFFNENHLDFRPDNLIWRRKKKHNVAGAKMRHAKINQQMVEDIRYLLNKGEMAKHVAECYNISTSLVSQIRYGRRWAAAGGPVKFKNETISVSGGKKSEPVRPRVDYEFESFMNWKKENAERIIEHDFEPESSEKDAGTQVLQAGGFDEDF